MRLFFTFAVLLGAILVCGARAGSGKNSWAGDDVYPFPHANFTSLDCTETGKHTWLCNNAPTQDNECIERCFVYDFDATVKSTCGGDVPFCNSLNGSCPVRIGIHTTPCTSCPCGIDGKVLFTQDENGNIDAKEAKRYCHFSTYQVLFDDECFPSQCVYQNCQRPYMHMMCDETLSSLGVSTGRGDTTLQLLFKKWWGHSRWPDNDFMGGKFRKEIGNEDSVFKAYCPCDPVPVSNGAVVTTGVEECGAYPDSEHCEEGPGPVGSNHYGCGPRDVWLEYKLAHPPQEVDCRKLESIRDEACEPLM